MKFAADIDVTLNESNVDRSIKKKQNDDRSERTKKKSQFKRRVSKLPLLKYNNCISLNTACTNILIEIHNEDIVNLLSKLIGNLK